MKIIYNFLIKKIHSDYVAILVGDNQYNFNGVIRLNEVGAYLFDILSNNDYTHDEISDLLVVRYGIRKEQAEIDLQLFLDKLKHAHLLEEE